MRCSTVHAVSVVAAAVIALPSGSRAQDSTAAATAAVACKTSTCQVVWDWGGSSAAAHGQDQRYGPASDLEVLIPQYLRDLGLKLSTSAGFSMTLTFRPRIRNAMCDVMAGTGTSMNCKTVQDLAVQFASTDSAVKAPASSRINNRCAAGDKFMTIREFSRFAADLIAYNLTDEKTRGRRPSSKC
jgi:hypothetical protein